MSHHSDWTRDSFRSFATILTCGDLEISCVRNNRKKIWLAVLAVVRPCESQVVGIAGETFNLMKNVMVARFEHNNPNPVLAGKLMNMSREQVLAVLQPAIVRLRMFPESSNYIQSTYASFNDKDTLFGCPIP